MTDVCVASTHNAAMDYGFENTRSLPMLLRQKTENLTEKYYSQNK
jgi:hypothetical protein